MAQTEFQVTYEGPAVEGGVMDVRDLGPSLMALGELFMAAGKALHPDREPPELQIKATSQGSFSVALIVHGHGLWDHFSDLLKVDDRDGLAALRDLIIGTASGVITTGLLAVLKLISGRTVTKSESSGSGTIALTLDDGTKLEIPSELLPLLESMEVRKTTRAVVQPLNTKGIEAVEFSTEETKMVKINKTDVSAFAVPDTEEILTDELSKVVVELASVSLLDGNKWRLRLGGETFSAALLDQSFLSRVHEGVEAFRSGDMMRCEIRTVQTRKTSGLHTEREVVEVIEHIPRDVQLPLIEPPHDPSD